MKRALSWQQLTVLAIVKVATLVLIVVLAGCSVSPPDTPARGQRASRY